MNRAVADIGKMDFQGNIIPMAWFSHLTLENGKPNTVAIVCLSEVIYWYRPVEIRDEVTGKVKGYRQKFKADKWQCNYQAMADRFGFTKEQVRNALHFLQDKGCITLEFRHFTIDSGTPLSNVLFVEPIPQRIAEINIIATTSDHIGTETDMGDVGLETDMGGDVGTETDTMSTPVPTHIGVETETYTETPTEIPTETPNHDVVGDFEILDFQTPELALLAELAGVLANNGMETPDAEALALKLLGEGEGEGEGRIEVCRRQLTAFERRCELARASKRGLQNPIGLLCASIQSDWPLPAEKAEKKEKCWYTDEEFELYFEH